MREILDQRLFSLSETQVTIGTLLVVAAIFVGGLLLSWILRRALARTFSRRGVEEGTLATIQRLTRYILFIITFGIALDTLGVNLGALFAAGALFAVGIGFAMQNITQNFVSGLILLIERAIKAGDIIVMNGTVVRVVDLGMRATLVRTLDDTVKNLTFRDRLHRLRAEVGVVYGSDMRQVSETLRDAATALAWRRQDKEPVVLWRAFGSSSVDFEVSVWTDKPWERQRQRSLLLEAIWYALKDANITIAFPQLDVHFDPQVVTTVQGRLMESARF